LAAATSCPDTTLTDCKIAGCTGTSAACNQTYANVASGIGCDDGVCNQCNGSGSCVNTGSGVAGPGCNAPAVTCSGADTCNGAGSCQLNNSADGTSCSTGTCTTGVCQSTPVADYIGYWRMNDGTGVTAADSYLTTPHNGTLWDGATTPGAAPPSFFSAGKVYGALAFDGINDNVRIADIAYGNEFSIAFWFKINNNAGSGAHTLINHGTMWGTNNVAVAVLKDGDPGAGEIWTYVSDGDDATAGFPVAKPTGGTWADGQWHHYALTVKNEAGNNCHVYVDNVERTSFEAVDGTINPATMIFLGTRSDGATNPLNGALDEVRLYNRKLSATEVANIYNNVTTPTPTCPGDPSCPPAPTGTTVTFTEDTTGIFNNPERGWYKWGRIDGNDQAHFDNLYASGVTLAYSPVTLTAYTATDPLPPSYVASLKASADFAKNAGVKLILRFRYREGGDDNDPSVTITNHHIDSVASLLTEKKAVIAVYQAGWMGDYGEMHGTQHINTDTNVGDWTQIIDHFYAAMPVDRFLQLRRPDFKTAYLSRSTAVTPDEAFTNTKVARIGHYNDCFLCDDDDQNTYDAPVEDWKKYIAKESLYVPAGGESGSATPSNSAADCAGTMAELKRLHWSFLSGGWYDDMTRDCTQAMRDACAVPSNPCQCVWDYGGCKDDIARNLGYRFVMTQVVHTTTVAPGDRLAIAVTLKNVGYAAMYNERPVYLVLKSSGGIKYYAKLTGDDVDPRRWPPEAGSRSFTRGLTVPTAAGTYTLALWLPDKEPSIRDNPKFAVRFANTVNSGAATVWNATEGYNVITTSFVIGSAPLNPGTIDGAFTTTLP
jgi:hypothetical protein